MRKQLSLGFSVAMMVLGLLLNIFHVGNAIFSFATVGNFLIYVGMVSLIITLLKAARPRKVDERMMAAAMQSNRITFVLIIIGAFTVMVVDGIRPIAVAYSTFMSYAVCLMVLIHLVTYKLLLRYRY